ncbi:tripartite tricarboxylate transporter TctB family protein [Mesosutterella sp. AGMB02718]|uniref:Tripartite tricarboxylate transporter TctB family protein n=1 Tax=Mesosutterella faecium TaxID=2925194 RepID=A0ABT7IQ48_9BURK|nr:tripartite tricarboxylate transporter TctB family protein [Mesosutterella sp. AGMB02718]MDL2059387.1 tripartite tricarboxylate transporter TctB family protein [Mesosutterella sp. AGMB02718]
MSIKNQRDFWAGILFAAFGIFFIVTAQENELGTAERMGPAYFPTLLGGCLALLGTVCAVKGFFFAGDSPDGGRVTRFNWKVLGLVLGGIVLFCLLLDLTGFVIALAVMITVCSAASEEFRAKEVIALIVILAALCWVVFVYLLGMTIPVIPAFLVK